MSVSTACLVSLKRNRAVRGGLNMKRQLQATSVASKHGIATVRSVSDKVCLHLLLRAEEPLAT